MDLAKWLKKGKKQIQGVVAQVIPGGENYKSVVNNKPVNRPAPTYGPQQAPQQQFNQTPTLAPSFNKPPSINQNGRNRIGGIDIQAPTISKPEEQNKVDEVIRKQQRQSIQDLTDKFNRGEINKQQRQAAAEATLGTQKKEFVKLGGVKGGINEVKSRGFLDAQQQANYTKGVEPITSRLQGVQDWVNSKDKEEGFQIGSLGDYGRFAANLLPGMAQGLIEAPVKAGQAISGERIGQNGQIEQINPIQRGGSLADAVISVAGLGIGGSGTLIKGATGNLTKTGLKQTGKKLSKDAFTEGTEELVQAFANDLADDSKVNTSSEEYLQSFGLGALGGGMMSGGGIGIDNIKGRINPSNNQVVPEPNIANNQTNQQQIAPEIEQDLQSPDPVVQQSAHDKLAGQTLPKVTEMPTVQGMQERMRAAKQNVMESVSSFKDKYGIKDEGGFIAGPLAGDFSSFQKQGKVFEGVDGKPRFEVSDEGAKLKQDYDISNGDAVIGDVLEHSKLYEQYPGMKNVPIEIRKDLKATAALDRTTGTMYVNPSLTESIATKTGDSGKITRKQVIGFLKSNGYTDAQINAETKGVPTKQLVESVLTQEEINTLTGLENPENITKLKKEAIPTILHELQHEIQDVEGFVGGGSPKNQTGTAIENYRNLAGEAEARAVAARKDMTDGERYKDAGGIKVYHGGAGVDTINKDGVKILSPEDKLKYASSGGGYVGLSTSADKNYAQQYSQNIAGHNRVAEISIKKDARIFELPEGQSIDDMSANELSGLSKKYDVIKSVEDNEYRILNEGAVASNRESTFYDSLDVPKEDLIIRDGKGKAMSVEPDAPVAKTDPQASLEQEAKKYKTAEEFVEAARSIENFDPAEAKTIFKDVKTGDGEAGVVKALTEFYNKANPSTETNITDPKLADNKIDTDDLKTERPQAYKMIDELSRELRDIDSANGVELIEPSVDAAYSATDDTYRVSTNTPFYKQHYKDTGRKPTLGHYRDEARRILSGGTDNSYGVVGPDQVAEFNHALVEQPSTEAYANTPEAIELDTQAKLENEVKELRKQAARKPLSTPVDTTPAIAKRVNQKENAEIAKLRKQIKNEKAQKQKKAAIEAKQRADRVAAKKAKLANKIPDTPKARAKVATNTIPDLFSKYLDHDNKGYNKLENEKGNIPVINKKGSYIESNRKTKDISRKNFKFAEESIAKGLHNMSKSDNKAARSIPRMLQYISKNAGQDPRMVEAASRFAGENTYTDSALLTLGEEAYKLLPDEASRERVHATLDPNSVIADMVKNKNNDYVEQRNAPKYDDLSKNEQKAADMLRDMGEAINDSSYRAGMISQEVWQKNKGGKYIARMYEDIKNSKDVVSEVGISESAAQQLFTGMYKSREKLNDALREKMLRDPVKLAVIRARQVRNNEALSNYVQEADSSGYISDKPKDGWVKVPYDQANNGHMFMNNWGGKFMRRDVYENINGYTSGSQAINHMNNILDLYDGNPARRLRKKLLTVYNPVVRTGNITSNYLFAYLNGVNPATFTANKRWAKSVMDNKKGGSKGSDPLYIEAQRQGLIGNSILRSDRNLFNTDKEWQRDIKNRNVKTKFTDKVRDKVDRFEKRYGEADDLSKLSALKTHVDRGHSVADAIEMTKRGFQDYNRVGHMYDMGAKSPVFGNAFIRFQGDLWTGILKNAAIDHPLRLAALPVATYAMGQALSGIMGEDEEDKETRENRAGAPKIPFTDISTEFQTPFGAFDASRFLGVYNREDLDGNDFTDEISKLLPFNVINPLKLNTAEGKTDAVSKMASDPLIGPLLSVLFDTDYRGKSISDPDGVRNGQELFPDEKLSDKDKWRNRRQYLVEAYMPYPYREGSDIVASSTEKMRNEQSVRGGKNDPSNPDASFLEREGYNNSGSKKTVGQSLARLFGVRLEQYGEDEAKTQRERNEMFSFFDEVDDWKETLDTETRKKFDSRHKSNTSRSGVAEEFADNPFYKYKNAAELRDDNLFNAEKKYAEMQNKKDGKPIDPLFNLPKDQRNMVLWKNSLPPGAKDDAVTAMYDQDWYEQFRNEQGKYFGAKDKYAEKRGFNKFTDTNPYPKPTDELQGVIDGYYDLSSGQRTSWRNKNPGLYQQMKDQFAKQDEWTNTERAKLGLPPIEDKYGKYAKSGSGGRGRGKGRGRGRGGRGGGGSNAIAKSLASSYKLQADTLGKLTQLLNSTTKKPTAGMNAGKKVVTKKPNLKKITVNMSSKG